MGKQDNNIKELQPEFGDAKTVTRLFGFSRTHIYNLIASGEIRSACIRRKGAFRGRRLIDIQSVRDFVSRNIDSPASRH